MTVTRTKPEKTKFAASSKKIKSKGSRIVEYTLSAVEESPLKNQASHEQFSDWSDAS
jgi:hypothetical protein